MSWFLQRLLLVLTIVVVSVTTSAAGGPLLFTTLSQIGWTGPSITYKIDDGTLGGIATPEIQALVQSSFEQWSNVPTANISISQTPLGEDVSTVARYNELIRSKANGSVFVLDDDGSIVEALLGTANKQQILGWARPLRSKTNIVRFYALINGHLTKDRKLAQSTIVHEIGHALGLDHSQVNAHVANNHILDDDDLLPTMFPTATDDNEALADLNPDDMAWISALYPSSTFKQVYGSITGQLRDGNDVPVLGANIVAVRVTSAAGSTPIQESLKDRFSCVTDYLMAKDGTFVLHLPVGRYRLRVEPILPGFVAGSSVGPYARDAMDVSFMTPVKSRKFTGEIDVAAGTNRNIGALKIE